MRESLIERTVNKYAKSTGWLTYKFASPSNRGVPDDLYIKNGAVLFIEFKATGGKPRPLQIEVIKKIRQHGGTVYVIDDIQKGKEVLDNAFN